MKLTPVQRLSAATKYLVGLVITGAGLVQIPAVKNAIIPLMANHPHFSTLIGALVTIGALIANPQVQAIIGIEQRQKVVETPDGTKTTTTDSAVKVE